MHTVTKGYLFPSDSMIRDGEKTGDLSNGFEGIYSNYIHLIVVFVFDTIFQDYVISKLLYLTQKITN